MLVGADGTFSKVRGLLHDIKPAYSGISMYDMMIPASSMTDELRNYIGVGGNMIMDDAKGLIPQMNSGGKCKVYPGMMCAENWLDENPLPDQGKSQWIADTLFGDWHSLNHKVLLAADEDTITPRKIWEFPPDLEWETDKTGVTVIGVFAFLILSWCADNRRRCPCHVALCRRRGQPG